jgi:hypothetical protein
MKAVQVGKYQIDIILENSRFIDIYTYYDFDDDDFLSLSNGKGWRLNELSRYDRQSSIEYKLSAESARDKFLEGFWDFEINYTKNNVDYKRLLIINDQDGDQYVTQDMISTKEIVLLTDVYGLPKFTVYKSTGGNTIKVDGDKATIYESIRNYSAFFDELYEEDIVEKYIFNPKTDFDNTNLLLQDFYNFSRNIYVFGRQGEEPRVEKIIGDHTATYEIIKRENGEKKVLCKNPNKYSKLQMPTYHIDK